MASNFGELHQNSEPLGTVGKCVNEFIAAVKPLRYFDDFIRSETVSYGLARTASCLTRGPSDVAVLSRAGFRDLQPREPRLADKFLLSVLQRNVAHLRTMTHAVASVLL